MGANDNTVGTLVQQEHKTFKDRRQRNVEREREQKEGGGGSWGVGWGFEASFPLPFFCNFIVALSGEQEEVPKSRETANTKHQKKSCLCCLRRAKTKGGGGGATLRGESEDASSVATHAF